ncbi:MAG: dihydroorotase, partial [Desulfobacterales bacterium]
MFTRIQGGRVIDPGRLDAMADIIVQNDKIVDISEPAQTASLESDTRFKDSTSKTIDASGKIVCPGLIDMHVHL